MRSMQMLLIEDEEAHCIEYKKYISTLDRPISFYIANGESEGLRLLQLFPFDIMILDLELQDSDGDGLRMLKGLRYFDLPNMPYIIVITNNPSKNTKKCARKNGADYYIWKGKRDYSAKFVVDFACDYFLSMSEVKTKKPQRKKINTIEDDIRSRTEKIITDGMKGRNYIIEAIKIVATSTDIDIDLKNDVYPKIAKRYGKSEWSIEKAIETAINKAWTTIDEKTLGEYYSAPVSEAKGSPTNKELIFHYANRIKEERKA